MAALRTTTRCRRVRHLLLAAAALALLFTTSHVRARCGVSLRRGRRGRMEDRAVCVPSLGALAGDSSLAGVSMYGVFDGHEGQAASQLLADSLPRRLVQAARELMEAEACPEGAAGNCQVDGQVQWGEAARRALAAVDTEFLELAAAQRLMDGSTAVVAVVEGHHLVVAHVGDSKALLCSGGQPVGNAGRRLQRPNTTELTHDHSLERQDERARVEAAGGTAVHDGRLRRLNGELAVSRAIGDLPYRQFGLISSPEIRALDLRGLDATHAFLLLASDGVFEVLTPGEVCAIAGAAGAPGSHPPFKAASRPADPIALGPTPGHTPEDDHAKDNNRAAAAATATAARFHSHWGLLGCLDCDPQTVTVASDLSRAEVRRLLGARQQRSTCGSLETLIARSVQEEAYNRTSLDNLAVVAVALDVGPDAAGSAASTAPSSAAGAGLQRRAATATGGSSALQVVGHPGGGHEYRLNQLLAAVPRAVVGAVVRHRHWDGETLPVGLMASSCDHHACLVATGPEVDEHGMSCRASGGPEGTCELGGSQPAGDWAALGDGGRGALLQLPPAASQLIASLGSVPILDGAAGDATEEAEAPRHWLRLGDAAAADGGGGGEAGRGGWLHTEHGGYQLQGAFASGSFGEVWHCTRHSAQAEEAQGDEDYVLKRMMVEKGAGVRLSGQRERYYGELFREAPAGGGAAAAGAAHLVRYVESFEADGGRELWLVFRDEGVSLHSLMYEATDGGGLTVLQPSRWWRAMRRRPDGHEAVLSLVRQALLALASVHARNVTHRDVKPENLLGAFHPCTGGRQCIHLRLIDFGSAVDRHSAYHLYGPAGPSNAEQTVEYAPPEALFGALWPGHPVAKRTAPYDVWSAGVVWLEMLLGTPHVFQVGARTRAMLDARLQLSAQLGAEGRQRLFLLRGMMELCIYPPLPAPKPASDRRREGGDSAGRQAPVQWSCSDTAVMELLAARDPSGRGLPSVLAARLLRAMLQWNPAARPSAEEALRHAVFSSPLAPGDEELLECAARPRSASGWC